MGIFTRKKKNEHSDHDRTDMDRRDERLGPDPDRPAPESKEQERAAEDTRIAAPPADGDERVLGRDEHERRHEDKHQHRVLGGDDDGEEMMAGGPVKKRGAFSTLRKTIREFLDDECTDIAASLTYYSVLAIFPAMLALVSLLGVVGEAERSVNTMLDVLRPIVSAATLDSVEPTLRELASQRGAGFTLIAGLLGALWSASAYVGAFGRAMNRILEVEEGRPIWKLRPVNLLITLVTILLCAAGLLIIVVSGPVAQSIGNTLGLGDQAVLVWDIAKWPVLGMIVVAAVATLYRYTPNVKAKFRILTTGAFFAILVWVIASVGFAFYVGNFGNYNKTYGAVAGVVVGLLWLWLTNVALLFGAELDSEIKRSRQLHDGLPAEEHLQVALRDASGVRKNQERREKDIESGRQVRLSHVGPGEHGDRPFARKP